MDSPRILHNWMFNVERFVLGFVEGRSGHITIHAFHALADLSYKAPFLPAVFALLGTWWYVCDLSPYLFNWNPVVLAKICSE